MNALNENVCTIVVSARDRFSLTEECLEALRANTPEPHALVLVLGGAPEELKDRLRARWGERVKLIFEPRFLNCAQARNIGLRAAATKLTVCLDNDVFVRPGWLPPLLRCQRETGAGLVVPLMLENATQIHAAGNQMYITYKGGRPFLRKVLPLNDHPALEGTNLKRAAVDYGEMHLQLVDTEAALSLGILDERIQEGEELDTGLAWKRGGRSIWFEPESVVVYDFPLRLDDPMDIPLFCWRWDIRNLIPGYRVMHEKWDMDMTELGGFKYFLMHVNSLVGWLPRLWPSRLALAVDRFFERLLSLSGAPRRIWTHLRAWSYGYYDWVSALEDDRPAPRRIADELLTSLPLFLRPGRRSALTRTAVSDGVFLDAYWTEDEHGRGPGASVYVRGEEALRIACLGPGRGYCRVYPGRAKRWDIPRFYLKEETVPEQIDASALILRRELAAVLAPEALERAAGLLAQGLRGAQPA